MDDLQAMDAIMTALDLLQGGTQCINQHHQVKMSEYEDVGTGTESEINGGGTPPKSTSITGLISPMLAGDYPSLSRRPNSSDVGVAHSGDAISNSGAGCASNRGPSRHGQDSSSGARGASHVGQTYIGHVTEGFADVGPAYEGSAIISTGSLDIPLFVQRTAYGASMFDEDEGEDEVDLPVPHLKGRRQAIGPNSPVTSSKSNPATKRKRPRPGNKMSMKASQMVQSLDQEQDKQQRTKARNIYHAQMSRRRRKLRQAVLEQETAWLQRDISRLEADIRCLSKEVDVFSNVLTNHSCLDVFSDV
ncbi:uncharacterized protein LOC124146346 isoform X1 [Haliotis rufescens]|uniref:uncharacterized protein LOC124146346 isoform X1 n=1 Tax=Haliotis rufescens TaxID=6454 RepID=UPI001EB03DD0|nr:uncharacterized protein LOC124146346 isoform X1 [Haliotis rufescens]